MRTVLAWAVHLFTASGVVCCLLAIEATFASEWRTALGWLAVAVIVDAMDGALARRVGVREVLPGFDGALLDNLVDYVNYVVVPALLIHRAGLVPAVCSFFVAATICLASAYQFCQSDAKTTDYFFKGFPSYWNVVALYLLALGLSPMVNLLILVALVVLVFVPIKYLYISRMSGPRGMTLAITGLWGVAIVVILWRLPQPPTWLVWLSLLYVVFYVAMSVYQSRRGLQQG